MQSQRWLAQSSRTSRTLLDQGPEVSYDWDSSVRVCHWSPASLGPLWAGPHQGAHLPWQVAQSIFADRHCLVRPGEVTFCHLPSLPLPSSPLPEASFGLVGPCLGITSPPPPSSSPSPFPHPPLLLPDSWNTGSILILNYDNCTLVSSIELW